MRILFLAVSHEKQKTRQTAQNYADFIKDSFGDRDYKISYALLDDLLISVSNEAFEIADACNDRPLHEYDVIITRGNDMHTSRATVAVVAEYAKLNDVVLANDYGVKYDPSKLLQMVKAKGLGVPIPATTFVTSSRIAYLKESLTNNQKYPAVLKSTHGSRGKDNYLVHSFEEIYAIVTSNNSLEYVLQNRLQNTSDYRILLMGSQYLVVKRTNVGETHLTNISQGGTSELSNDFPLSVINQAKEIAKNFGLLWTGVDMMQDSNDGVYYFLEANLQPQIKTGGYDEQVKRNLAAFFDEYSKE